jgi:MOSC domain-containing protein YiiM
MSPDGTVLSLHRKAEKHGERGLPKPSVAEIQVEPAGVVGDFNRWRHEEGHDDPTSAVLFMPEETLEDLRREGWPVRPGDLGENVRTQGIPYARLAPGTRLAIGTARLTITRRCDPCNNLFGLPYVGTDKGPEFLKTTLDRRGMYARVDAAGAIRAGDPILLLTDA